MDIDSREPSVNDDDGAMKPPERKKLRSSNPDLKISVGANDEAVDYWYHSSIMANHSNYIDAMLATPMKESTAYEIGFPDISPNTWDCMLKYLEAPAEARLMTIQDAMEAAPWYDKYDFRKGCQLCDQVLKEYFRDKNKILSNLNCFVDAVLLADAANLNEAKKVGVAWLHQTFNSTDSHTGPIIFTENHISKLVPLIIKEDNLFRVVKAFYGNGTIKSKEDLWSPLFPRALVMAYREWETHRILTKEISHIMLSGTGCKADGIYTRESSIYFIIYESRRRGRWAGVQVDFTVIQLRDGWAIICETLPEYREEGDGNYVKKVLWHCPNSQNIPLPPRDGWIPVDELAGGQPTVRYCMNDRR